MKRFIKSKKGIALLATLVVAAAAAVGAYAYLTSNGSGWQRRSLVATQRAFICPRASPLVLFRAARSRSSFSA